MYDFYVCDNNNCKAHYVASNSSSPDSKIYNLTILTELFNDGIWPIPYIGASILTPLALWFLGVEITVRSFAILFFVGFVVIYFMFSFFGHHYLRPLSGYVYSYIDTSCPNDTTLDYNQEDEQHDNQDDNQQHNQIDEYINTNDTDVSVCIVDQQNNFIEY